MSETHIDSPDRYDFIQSLIRTKKFLDSIYMDDYSRLKRGLSLCPISKPCLEIGSGAGFLKRIIPEIITSDIIPYKGVDRVIDATSLPFEDESLCNAPINNRYQK